MGGDTGGAAYSIVKSAKKVVMEGVTSTLLFAGNPSWNIADQGDRYRSSFDIDEPPSFHYKDVGNPTSMVGTSYVDVNGANWNIVGVVEAKSHKASNAGNDATLIAVHRNDDIADIKALGAFIVTAPSDEQLASAY